MSAQGIWSHKGWSGQSSGGWRVPGEGFIGQEALEVNLEEE